MKCQGQSTAKKQNERLRLYSLAIFLEHTPNFEHDFDVFPLFICVFAKHIFSTANFS
jgi:hypothetical protein